MNNTLNIVILWTLTTVTAAADQTNVVKSLTFDECVTRALANNLDIQIQSIDDPMLWVVNHNESLVALTQTEVTTLQKHNIQPNEHP